MSFPRVAFSAALALVVSLAGSTAFAADQQGLLPDATIQRIIEHRLDKKDLTSNGHVDVRVNGGAVVLGGTVATLADRDQAERLARGVDDVVSVDNQLELVTGDVSDQALADKISGVLGRFTLHDIFDWVEARVENGHVTLTGSVYQAWHQEAIPAQIEHIPGVRAIDNEIEVLPVSLADDQIRFQAARAIFRNLNFIDYSTLTNSPIHIVVKNGHVWLEGNVRSAVDKRLAEILVRTSTLAFGVTNDLRVGD